MQFSVNAENSAGINTSIQITFSDTSESFGLDIRNGAVEFTEGTLDTADVAITLGRMTWLGVMSPQPAFENARQNDAITVNGDEEALQQFLAAYANAL